MALYTDITADRLTAGRLWTPALSLDLMSRDWSNICRPWTYYLVEKTGGGLGTWQDIAPAIEMAWPSFDVDASFDPDLEVRMMFSLEAKTNASGYYELRFNEAISGITTPSQVITGSWVTYDWEFNFTPAVNMPNSAVLVQCQRLGASGNDVPGGDTVSVRQIETDPTFYIQARIVP